MSRSISITGDQLTNALRALDVKFIMGWQIKGESLHKQPARLISALAQSDESRLRLSLISLFLEHPEFARLYLLMPGSSNLRPGSRFNAITALRSGSHKNTMCTTVHCPIISPLN